MMVRGSFRVRGVHFFVYVFSLSCLELAWRIYFSHPLCILHQKYENIEDISFCRMCATHYCDKFWRVCVVHRTKGSEGD